MAPHQNGINNDRRFLAGKKQATPKPGEGVAITGMSGRLPNSYSIQDFCDKLKKKTDLCDEDTRRWFHNHPEIPRIAGKLYEAEKFDAGFFELHKSHSEVLCPMSKNLLERSFEAIIDAGINPMDLAGSKTGVYVGVCHAENEKYNLYESPKLNANSLVNCTRSTIAHRISYFLKLNGPSYTCDTACSSSMYAFERAYADIRKGECDRAIVGGSNLCIDKFLTLQFARLGVLNMNTGCRPFDEDVHGYTRSEAVIAFLLQKEKDSKRIYAHLIHAKSNVDGYKESGITFPSMDAQYSLLHDTYEECDVDPNNLAFLEAHGTGTKVGDIEELKAVDEYFCKNRKLPLYVGSVKGNIGHTEPASGLCSITKVLLCMETDCLLPNIHYNNPRKEITALKDGRLIVITENIPWPQNYDYSGVNCFGFGGANSHAVLKRNQKSKTYNYDELPRLVCFSGRTQESIDVHLNQLSTSKLDYEFIRLMHDVYKTNIPNHGFRAFSVLTPNGQIHSSTAAYDGTKKPIYLCIGSTNKHYSKLLKVFMKIATFKATFDKINQILLSNNIKMDLLTDFPNNVLQQVMITICLHLGLIDIFKKLKIKFDVIVGNSMGDFTSAYANGSLTVEEVVLSTVGVSEIFLKSSKINENMPAKLLEKLKLTIPSKSRHVNGMFVSKENIFEYASAEYFVFNIINPKMTSGAPIPIQNDAIIIDIDYDTKLTPQNTRIKFLQEDNNLADLMVAIGQLYQCGQQPHLHELYPAIQFPVSRGTPMISHLIRWDHRKDFYLGQLRRDNSSNNNEKYSNLSILNSDLLYYKGHVIDGRNLFPATGYLFLIWDFYAHLNDLLYNNLKICFENVRYHRATPIPKDGELNLYISISNDGNFEVSDGSTSLVTGIVSEVDDLQTFQPISGESSHPLLNQKDIYKELRLRGYNYKGAFCAVQDYQGEKGTVQWAGNWVTFLDNLLQLSILQEDTRSLYVPTGIDRLVIDASKHLEEMEELGEDKFVPVIMTRHNKIIRTNHIEIRGLSANSIARKRQIGQPVLEINKFIPNNFTTTLENSMRINVQTIMENKQIINVKVLELYDNSYEVLTPHIQQVLGDLPLIQPEMTIITDNPLDIKGVKFESKLTDGNYHILTGCNLITNQVLKKTTSSLLADAFIISVESNPIEKIADYNILTSHKIGDKHIYLIRKKTQSEAATIIHVSDNFTVEKWLGKLQKQIKTAKNLILFAHNDNFNGILGLVNCIRKEPGGDNVRCVFIQDSGVEFKPNDQFYKEQLDKNLAINVLSNKQWGAYRHVLLSENCTIPTKHCFANNTSRGDLSTLQWIEGRFSNMKSNEDLIKVHYASLNFRDVMLASGKILAETITKNRMEQECIQGFEFSGTDKSGKKYMGMIIGGAISNYVKKSDCILMDVPNFWSLEEAATIPVVYGTVLTALKRADFKPGQSILIHSGTGGVGQAAINVCTYYKMTIFITVGTKAKKEFLLKNYPTLKSTHIGNSRDTSFEEMILKETDNKGVDIILNSLAEEKLQASVRCLRRGGSFLEIGKFDLANNSKLSMELIGKEASFHGILLDMLFRKDKSILKRRGYLTTMLTEEINKGYIKPLLTTTFEMNQIEEAYRYMSTGNHMGKVVIKIKPDETIPAIPRFYCQPELSYVILGGLGGFGLELADWLVIRGCKNLILSSRSGIQTGYQEFRINIWKNYGTNVTICSEDITTYEGCEKLIKKANNLAPIGGIFNLAVVLKDGILENQTVADFTTSLKPKALATMHLDKLTRQLCPKLEYFVVFSSVSCGRGNAGQTNYGMSNSIMERICENRKANNLPALAIQWGAVGDVGLVAEMQKENTEIAIGGTLQQRISGCLEVMDRFMRQNEPIVSSIVVAEKYGFGSSDNITDAVMGIMGMRDLKGISMHSTLAELGMDSMMAVEIKQILERDYDVFLSTQDMRNLTFSKLNDLNDNKDSISTVKSGEVLETTMADDFQMIIQNTFDDKMFDKPTINIQSSKGGKDEIILFPGIEGTAVSIKELAKKLNSNCCCFQYTHTNNLREVSQIFENLWPHIAASLKGKKTFKFVAHSYGSLMALEAAHRLEKMGYSGQIALIDGSPLLISRFFDYFKTPTDEQFDCKLIIHTMQWFCSAEVISKLSKEILAAPDLDTRINIAHKQIPKDSLYSTEFLGKITKYLINVTKSMGTYQPAYSNKLKSKVVLLKPTMASARNLSEDMELSPLCEHPVDVTYYEGNHQSILNNESLAEYLRKYFST